MQDTTDIPRACVGGYPYGYHKCTPHNEVTSSCTPYIVRKHPPPYIGGIRQVAVDRGGQRGVVPLPKIPLGTPSIPPIKGPGTIEQKIVKIEKRNLTRSDLRSSRLGRFASSATDAPSKISGMALSVSGRTSVSTEPGVDVDAVDGVEVCSSGDEWTTE